MAMDVSCHSFIRMAKLAEPLMPNGGCLLTVTFYGSEKVVAEYNLMGPVKAALESAVRYMAAELGDKRIRVHAISPGPLKTRAASGIAVLRRADGAHAPAHPRTSPRQHRRYRQSRELSRQRRGLGSDRQYRIYRCRLSHSRLSRRSRRSLGQHGRCSMRPIMFGHYRHRPASTDHLDAFRPSPISALDAALLRRPWS